MATVVKVNDNHCAFLGTKVEDIYKKYMKTAKQDFVVIKMLRVEDGRYFSPYRNFEYTKRKTYKTPFNIQLEWEHLTITSGFHSVPKNPKVKCPEGYEYGLFVVPKGSDFFVDSYDDDIVSNQIKFVGIVK